MIVLDKFRGGRELVPGRELVHHHYTTVGYTTSTPISLLMYITGVLNGCAPKNVFTHGFRNDFRNGGRVGARKSLSGLYLRNCKV